MSKRKGAGLAPFFISGQEQDSAIAQSVGPA